MLDAPARSSKSRQIGLPAAFRTVEPSFGELSRHLYCPFRTARFSDPRIAWLNIAWLAANGIDLGREDDRALLTSWLIERFAVGVPSRDDPPEIYSGDGPMMFADRYGATAGAMHGGSGRVGTIGAFNAKGIGRTPLVSPHSDWYHSHGCMFLEEAVREAVLSCVASRLFPYGAVPTIAVIDVGARIHWDDGTAGARRAIIVRPAFLRLSSFFRTIFFGTGGTENSDQVADAAKVNALWRAAADGRLPFSDFPEVFRRMGEQYGFGRAMRLWPGPPFASNLTLDGKLVDFGSFRALPNWAAARGEAGSHAFGKETQLCEAIAQALRRNALCNDVCLSSAALLSAFDGGLKLGFTGAAVSAGLDAKSVDELRDLVRQQQRRSAGLEGETSAEAVIGSLQPFRSLYRETLLENTETMIANLSEGPTRDSSPIGHFIDKQVAAGVRHISGLDRHSY